MREIHYCEVNKSELDKYDSIPMTFCVESEYCLSKIDGGLGGFLLKEVPVKPYIKDLGQYEHATEYEQHFDITNWNFFMAFDGERPVGGATIAARTSGMDMLDGRDDLCVLWDLRVAPEYRRIGIGKRLFGLACERAAASGCRQLKIECQSNNPSACKFYRKQGAVLSCLDEYAYYSDPSLRTEIQLIWYLQLSGPDEA